jgi:archaellum component FlaD/FlaE
MDQKKDPLIGDEDLESRSNYVLADVPDDTAATVHLLRWIDYLLHRVKRERIMQLMCYYEEIGWIGPRAKEKILGMTRGILQDASSFAPGEEFLEDVEDVCPDPGTHRINEYRLTASEHMRSLMYINKIRGGQMDRAIMGAWSSEFEELSEN